MASPGPAANPVSHPLRTATRITPLLSRTLPANDARTAPSPRAMMPSAVARVTRLARRAARQLARLARVALPHAERRRGAWSRHPSTHAPRSPLTHAHARARARRTCATLSRPHPGRAVPHPRSPVTYTQTHRHIPRGTHTRAWARATLRPRTD
eukprot:468502-Prymnesium_polylepis.2